MGRFTQSAYILLKQAPDPDEIYTALHKQQFPIVRHERGTDLLTLASASVVFEITLQNASPISVLIDIMQNPWPDTISQENPIHFLSWHSGAFGAFAYPGCLERALHECRTWPEAEEAVKQHTALLRLRVADKQEPGTRQRTNKVTGFDELSFLTRLLLALGELPEVSGYFFAGGEALCSYEILVDIWKHYLNNGCHGFDLWLLWINRRLLRTPEEPDWAIIDVVGLQQIGMADVEACFQHVRYRPEQVANWLLNVASYLYEHGPVIEDGHTLTGPGNINWQAHKYESSLQFPPRPVLCLRPVDNSMLPRRFMKRLNVTSPNKSTE